MRILECGDDIETAYGKSGVFPACHAGILQEQLF